MSDLPTESADTSATDAQTDSVHPRSARLVLTLGLAFGLGAIGYRLTNQPSLVGADFAIYVRAAEALLAGEAIYGVPLESAAWAQYLYPPGTAPALVPPISRT
jgi:hypothetical protein